MSVSSDGLSEMGGDLNSVYDSADSDNAANTTEANVRGLDLAVLKQRRFAQKKTLIAELCESILGAPDESLVQPKSVGKGQEERSRMEQLHALVRTLHSSAPLSCTSGTRSISATSEWRPLRRRL